MANLKRRHHYLPECYQKGFTNSAGQVWVKFADRPKPELRRPKSVGRTQSLYIIERDGQETDRLEDFLGEEIDAPFAVLSQRIKDQKDKFSDISGDELAALCKFVAFQAVRTLSHRSCIEEQASGPVDSSTFVQTMGRLVQTLLGSWRDNFPNFYFYTSLPHVADRFITGDHPVVVVVENENLIWQPTAEPTLRITSIKNILTNPKHGFQISLSPYVCLLIRDTDGKPHLPPQSVDPQMVRSFNNLIRGQSRIFILARDVESLA